VQRLKPKPFALDEKTKKRVPGKALYIRASSYICASSHTADYSLPALGVCFRNKSASARWQPADRVHLEKLFQVLHALHRRHFRTRRHSGATVIPSRSSSWASCWASCCPAGTTGMRRGCFVGGSSGDVPAMVRRLKRTPSPTPQHGANRQKVDFLAGCYTSSGTLHVKTWLYACVAARVGSDQSRDLPTSPVGF
jgi:hypothetical protein